MIIEGGKPSDASKGIVLGCVGALVLFFGGGALLGLIIKLLGG